MILWARVASGAFWAGTYSWRMPSRAAHRAMGRTPVTGRSAPVRLSSPKNAASSGRSFSSSAAVRIPSRMGRSYTVPSLRWLAGARFTVMRLTGNLAPQALMAARTRSRDSRTAASGRPTTSKAGSPPDRKHSTDTSYPLMPLRPRDRTVTTMPPHILSQKMLLFCAACQKDVLTSCVRFFRT